MNLRKYIRILVSIQSILILVLIVLGTLCLSFEILSLRSSFEKGLVNHLQERGLE